MSDSINKQTALLIDIGNSRIKVACLTQPEQLVFSCTNVAELVQWLTLRVCEVIFCANVRKEQDMRPLEDFCQRYQLRLKIIKTEQHAVGLTNSYADVTTMGVDRWLSMLACLAFNKPHYAVLMFGTAITCDIVSQGVHQGGWIIPGRHLMHTALTTNTARVFTDTFNTEQLALGQSTPHCVDAGCFATAMGVVNMAEQYLRMHFEQYCIFLTGGDDKVLTALKGDAIFRAENLVLQGLARYAMPS